MNQDYIVILIYNVNTKIQRYIPRYDVLSSDVLELLDVLLDRANYLFIFTFLQFLKNIIVKDLIHVNYNIRRKYFI